MADSSRGLTMFSEIKRHKIRFVKSSLFYASFLFTGLAVGIMGPSLIDLAVRTKTSLTETSLFLPFRAGGYVIGSFFCAIIYEKINVLIVCCVTMAIAGTIMLIVPLLTNVWAMIALFFIQGTQFGLNEATINVYIIHLWGKEVTPFMQALHFFFGLGALLSPLFTRPFLLPIEVPTESISDKCSGGDLNETVINTTLIDREGGNSSPKFTFNDFEPSDVQLIYPFCITFVFAMLLCICYIIMYIYIPNTEAHPSRMISKSNDDENNLPGTDLTVDLTAISPRTPSLSFNGSIRKRHDTISSQKFAQKTSKTASVNSKHSHQLDSVINPNFRDSVHRQISIISDSFKEEVKVEVPKVTLKWYQFEDNNKVAVIILAVAFFHVLYGLELTFGSFLTPFAVNSDVRMDTREGAKVSSVFWAAFTFWRLITVFYIGYTGPKLGILINLAILVLGNIIMIPFGFSHEWALYAGTVLIGLGISPLWGSMFGFLEMYFPVTSKMASSMMTSAAIGEFIMPAILAKYMDCQSIVFIWITLVTSVLTIITFLIIVVICNYKMTVSTTPNEPSIH